MILRFIGYFFLVVFLHSFAFAADNTVHLPANDSFITLINKAAASLNELCVLAPDHPYCANGGGADIVGGFEIKQQEKIVRGDLTAVGINVFSQSRKVDNNFFPILSDSERATYFAKMHYIDQMSVNQDPAQHQLVALLVYQLTMSWIDIYGDPFRDANLYVDETGRPTPARASAEHIDAAASVAGLATMAAFILQTPERKAVHSLLTGVSYLTLGLRQRLPIHLLSELGVAGAVGSVASLVLSYQTKNEMFNAKDMLPSPAHLITFGFNGDLNLIGKDIREQWAEKERKLYQDAVSDGAAVGASIFLSYLSENMGTKVAEFLAEKGLSKAGAVAEDALSPTNLKYLKFVKGFRVTPTGLVGGYLIGNVIDSSMLSWRLGDLTSKLEAAAKARDKNQVYFLIGDIVRLHMSSTEFIEQTLATEKALFAYAFMDGPERTFEDLIQPRSEFVAKMNPLNFPVATGASILRFGLCRLHSFMPTLDTVTKMSAADRKTISDNEQGVYTWVGYQYLTTLRAALNDFVGDANDITGYFNIEIPTLRRQGLGDAADMLKNYNDKFVALRNQVQSIKDKYSQTENFFENRNLELLSSAIRNIEEIELAHAKDFTTFNTDYFCNIKYENE